MADEHELGPVGDGVGRCGLLRPDLTWVVASEPLGVGTVHDREVQSRVEPALTITTNSGYTVRRGASTCPVRFGHLAQSVKVRPGTLRVDVVGGHRRNATPVVDTGIEKRAEVIGQVGRSLQVDVRWENEARCGDRPRGSRRSGRPALRFILVRNFGRKFWTITSCTWP